MKKSIFTMDKLLSLTLLLLILSMIASGVFYFIPAQHLSTCIPDNSFFDPSGVISSRLEAEPSSDFSRNIICESAIIPHASPYTSTSPFFYFFFDMSIVLSLFAVVRAGYVSSLLSRKIYFSIFSLFVLITLYLLSSLYFILKDKFLYDLKIDLATLLIDFLGGVALLTVILYFVKKLKHSKDL